MSNSLLYKEISLREEVSTCLLCHEAACTKSCTHGLKIDKIIRSYRFDNKAGAVNRLPEELPCFDCKTKDCISACVKSKINRAVPIDDIMISLSNNDMVKANGKLEVNDKLEVSDKIEVNDKLEVKVDDIDLSIDFCGIPCENPFFLSSSVVGSNYEMVAKAFEMGWAGVAFKTIGTFVPKEVSPRFDHLRKEAAPFIGFKNIEQISDHTLEENILYLKKLKEDYPTKIIVASIMGQNEEEWTYLAKLMTEAGVDIIECNFSCPHMAADGLGSDVGQNPELVATYTRATRKGTHLPILAKMTPNLGNMEIPAIAAMEAGATGIAAINTIKSIMNIDPDTFVSGPFVAGKTSVGGYSGKAVKPIALRFIHEVKTCNKLVDAPISGMGGIETWQDAFEFFALGCENIQVTTSVMQYGYRVIEDMIEGMKYYLSTHGYESIREIIGKGLVHTISTDELDRDSICYPKFDRNKCVGCGRCYLSCYDGGHQAIKQHVKTGQPILDVKKCVGCHLCLGVCPVACISAGKRVAKDNNRELVEVLYEMNRKVI